MRTLDENEMTAVNGGSIFEYVAEKIIEVVVEYVKDALDPTPET